MDSHLLSVVSHVLEIRGPGEQVGAASASGNAALIGGCRLLASGEADACLVIASGCEPSPVELRALANTGALSWERLSVPLSTERDGFTPGEAAAAVVLEPRGNGPRDRVRAHGTLRGWAHRLHGSAGPEPCALTEARVMRAALEAAQIAPEEVAYVNAHATGSREGDQAETAALDDVFAASSTPPWMNSTKSLTGHSLSAAGLVECVATLTQLDLGYLHPTVGLRSPMPSRLRHPDRHTGIARDAVALSNGYGFGGFNTSLVLSGGAAS
jgi:malonyl-ACP decarboxylase